MNTYSYFVIIVTKNNVYDGLLNYDLHLSRQSAEKEIENSIIIDNENNLIGYDYKIEKVYVKK